MCQMRLLRVSSEALMCVKVVIFPLTSLTCGDRRLCRSGGSSHGVPLLNRSLNLGKLILIGLSLIFVIY